MCKNQYPFFIVRGCREKKSDVQCLGGSQEETECRCQATSRVMFWYGVVWEECRTRVWHSDQGGGRICRQCYVLKRIIDNLAPLGSKKRLLEKLLKFRSLIYIKNRYVSPAITVAEVKSFNNPPNLEELTK